MRHVVGHRAAAHLQLERVVASALQQRFGFFDVAGGVAAGQRPQHRQALAHRAAQQRGHGHVQPLALRVQQRGLQRGLGKTVAARHLFQALHRSMNIGRVQACQRRRQIGIDGQLDAFGAFFAIGQAADGGGFPNAFDVVAALQAHDHQRLALHDRHGQLMGADGGQVHQNGFDRENACRIHTLQPGIERCCQYRLHFRPQSKTIWVPINTFVV
ncbi:hypothetical protein D3C71_1503580 [compost metagenome]